MATLPVSLMLQIEGDSDVQDRIREVSESLEDLEGSASSAERPLQDVGDSMSELENSASSVGDSLEDAGSSMDTLEGSASSAQSSLDDISNTMDSLEGSASSAQGSMDNMSNTLDNLDTSASSAQGSMDNMSTSLHNVDSSAGHATESQQGLLSSTQTSALAFSSAAGTAISLWQSYDTLQKSQLGATRAAYAHERAQHQLTTAEQRLKDVRADSDSTAQDVAKAEEEVRLAREAVSIAAEREEIMTGNVSQAYAKFVAGVAPKAISLISSLAIGFGSLSRAGPGAAAGVGGVGRSFKAMSLAPPLIAISALAALFIAIRTNAFGFRDALDSLGHKLGEMFPIIKPLLQGIRSFAEVIGLIPGKAGFAGKAMDKMKEQFSKFGGNVMDVIRDLPGIISRGFDSATDTITGWVRRAEEILGYENWDLSSFEGIFFTTIPMIVTNAGNYVREAVTGFVRQAGDALGASEWDLTSFEGIFFTTIPSIITNAYTIVSNAITSFVEMITDALGIDFDISGFTNIFTQTIPNSIRSAVGYVRTAVETFVSHVSGFFTGGWDFSGIWQSFTSAVTGIGGTIRRALASVANTIWNAVINPWVRIVSGYFGTGWTWDTVWRAFTSAATGIGTVIGAALASVRDTLYNAVVGPFVNSVSGMFGEGWDLRGAIGGALTSAGSGIHAALRSALDAADSLTGGIASDFINGILQQFREGWDFFGPIEDAFAGGGGIGDAIGRALRMVLATLATAFIAPWRAATTGLFGEGWNFFDVISNAFTGSSGIGAAIGSALSTIQGALSGAVNSFIAAVTDFFGSGWDFVSAIGSAFTGSGGILSAISGALSSVVSTVSGAVSSFIDSILGFFGVGWTWDDVWNAVYGIGDTIWGALQGAWNWLSGTVSGWIDSVVGWFQSWDWDSIWASVHAVGTTIWGALQGAWNYLAANVPGWVGSVVAWFQSWDWDSVWAGVYAIGDMIRGALSAAYDFIAPHVTGWVDSVVQWFQQWTWDDVWNGVYAIGGMIHGALSAAYDFLLPHVSGWVDSVVQWFQQWTWDDVWNGVYAVGSMIGGALQSAYDFLLPHVSGWVDSVVQWFQNWDWDSVKIAASGIGAYVLDGINEAKNWLEGQIKGWFWEHIAPHLLTDEGKIKSFIDVVRDTIGPNVVAGITQAAVYIAPAAQGFFAGVIQILNEVRDWATPIIEPVKKEVGDALTAGLDASHDVLVENRESWLAKAAALISEPSKWNEALSGVFGVNVGAQIGGAFAAALDFADELLNQTIPGWIDSLIPSFTGAVTDTISGGLDGAGQDEAAKKSWQTKLWEIVEGIFTGTIPGDILAKILPALGQGIWNIIQDVPAEIQKFASSDQGATLGRILTSIFTASIPSQVIGSLVAPLTTPIRDMIGGAIDQVAAAPGVLSTKFNDLFSAILEQIKTAPEALTEKLREVIGAAIDSVKAVPGALVDKAREMLGEILSLIPGVDFTSAEQAIGQTVEQTVDRGMTTGTQNIGNNAHVYQGYAFGPWGVGLASPDGLIARPVREGMNQAVTASAEGAAEVGAGLSNVDTTGWNTVWSPTGTIPQAVTNGMASAEGAVQAGTEQMGTHLGTVPPAAHSMQTGTSGEFSTLRANVGEQIRIISDTVSTMVFSFEAVMNFVKDHFRFDFSGVNAQLTAQTNTMITETTKMSVAFASHAASVQGVINSTITSAVSRYSQLINALAQFVISQTTQMSANWVAHATSVGASVNSFAAHLTRYSALLSALATAVLRQTTQMSTNWNSHGTIVQQVAGSRIPAAMNTMGNSVSSTASRVVADIQRMITAVNNLASQGSAAIARFTNAMVSNMNRLQSSVIESTRRVQELQRAIDGLRDKEVTVTTRHREVGGGGLSAGGSGSSGAGASTRAARGFEGVVTQPTRFFVAEGNKPEFVSVTPLEGNANAHMNRAAVDSIIEPTVRAGTGAKKSVVRTVYHKDGRKVIYYSDGSTKTTKYKMVKDQSWGYSARKDFGDKSSNIVPGTFTMATHAPAHAAKTEEEFLKRRAREIEDLENLRQLEIQMQRVIDELHQDLQRYKLVKREELSKKAKPVEVEHFSDGKKIVYYNDRTKVESTYKIKKGEDWQKAAARDRTSYKFVKQPPAQRQTAQVQSTFTIQRDAQNQQQVQIIDPRTGAVHSGGPVGSTFRLAAPRYSSDVVRVPLQSGTGGKYGIGGIWHHAAFGGQGDRHVLKSKYDDMDIRYMYQEGDLDPKTGKLTKAAQKRLQQAFTGGGKLDSRAVIPVGAVTMVVYHPGGKREVFFDGHKAVSNWKATGGGSTSIVKARKGFEGFVTKPTQFTVGEGSKPEFVSVQPFKDLAGSITSMMGKEIASLVQKISEHVKGGDDREYYSVSRSRGRHSATASAGNTELSIVVPVQVDGKELARVMRKHMLTGISSYT